MTLRRTILVWAYLAAVLAAPASHDHSEGRGVVPRAVAACQTPGAHFADHPDAPDLSHAPDHCPACRAGSTGAVELDSTSIFLGLRTAPVAEAPGAVPPSPTRLHHPSRAPPLLG